MIMGRIDGIQHGDVLKINVPLVMERSHPFWGTKKTTHEVKLDILVEERDGKFNLIATGPVLT